MSSRNTDLEIPFCKTAFYLFAPVVGGTIGSLIFGLEIAPFAMAGFFSGFLCALSYSIYKLRKSMQGQVQEQEQEQGVNWSGNLFSYLVLLGTSNLITTAVLSIFCDSKSCLFGNAIKATVVGNLIIDVVSYAIDSLRSKSITTDLQSINGYAVIN